MVHLTESGEFLLEAGHERAAGKGACIDDFFDGCRKLTTEVRMVRLQVEKWNLHRF
jgi:hypothetical protein